MLRTENYGDGQIKVVLTLPLLVKDIKPMVLGEQKDVSGKKHGEFAYEVDFAAVIPEADLGLLVAAVRQHKIVVTVQNPEG